MFDISKVSVTMADNSNPDYSNNKHFKFWLDRSRALEEPKLNNLSFNRANIYQNVNNAHPLPVFEKFEKVFNESLTTDTFDILKLIDQKILSLPIGSEEWWLHMNLREDTYSILLIYQKYFRMKKLIGACTAITEENNELFDKIISSVPLDTKIYWSLLINEELIKRKNAN